MNTIDKPLLEVSKGDIAVVLASLSCNAGGKHAYFRVLRAFFRWACQEDLLAQWAGITEAVGSTGSSDDEFAEPQAPRLGKGS